MPKRWQKGKQKRPENLDDRRPESPRLGISFDISTACEDAYRLFIWRMLCEVAIPGDTCHNIYLLEAQANTLEKKRSMLFDVTIVDGEEKEVSLRYRRDNLYLIGYRSGQVDKWNEFKEGERLIPDSELLNYSGSYTNLQENGKNILELKVGKYQIENAFSTLYKPVKEEKIRATSLMIIILMTSEAVRFKSIMNFIATSFDESKEITEEIRDIINNWSAISRALLESKDRTDLHPYFKDLAHYEKVIDSIQVLLNVSK